MVKQLPFKQLIKVRFLVGAQMIDLNIKDEWGGIDEKIKPLIFELNRLEIPTSGSCEGHVDHGFPGPWVSIYTPKEKLGLKLY